jgi:hypothetical protein
MLDYAAAVELADSALTAMFESLRRPERTWTVEDRETAAVAFAEWLREHPNIEEVLQDAAEFERFSMEDYIAIHSVAWEVLSKAPEPGAPIDPDCEGAGVLIRRVAGEG